MSVGTPLPKPGLRNESFSPMSKRSRPAAGALYLPGSARAGGIGLRAPQPLPCRVADPSLVGTEQFQARSCTWQPRCSHHGGCAIYGSRSVQTQVSPRWSSRYTSSSNRLSGVREGSRSTEHPPLTANNSRDGARACCCPRPIPTAESVLHLAGRFFPSGIDSGNHPESPTCPPLPCRGSSLGLRRRSQGPRADMDRVVLEARSQSQAFRA